MKKHSDSRETIEGFSCGVHIPEFIWERFQQCNLTPKEVLLLAWIDRYTDDQGNGCNEVVFKAAAQSLRIKSGEALENILAKLVELRLVYVQRHGKNEAYICSWTFDQLHCVAKELLSCETFTHTNVSK